MASLIPCKYSIIHLLEFDHLVFGSLWWWSWTYSYSGLLICLLQLAYCFLCLL